MKFLPFLIFTAIVLVACGPSDPPPAESAGPSPTPVTEPVTVPTPATKPAVKSVEPVTSQAAVTEPVPNLPSEPALELQKPTERVSTPMPTTESQSISEPADAKQSIRRSSRERFVEEQRLELKDQRWYVIGEEEPYSGWTKRWTVEGWKQAQGAYLNGLQHGRWKTWWDNGNLRSAIEFREGRPNGSATHWHTNGQRKTEGAFANGKFTATAKWDENGEPLPIDSASKP